MSYTLRPRNRTRPYTTEAKRTTRRKSKETTPKEENMLPTTNPYTMQHLSLGLELLDPFTKSLDCKENLAPSVQMRSHASKSSNIPLETPPSCGQENASPIPSAKGKAAKKPLPFGSTMGPVHATSPLSPASQSLTPLPSLSWANSAIIWDEMRRKDRSTKAPETELHQRHPCVLPTMRTILLDWMLEVCEEYRLHRETYYLALDMYDRFMDSQKNIQKEQLQLIGVTCLFIASKIEEIYPPKLAEFAYVTDGACTADQIVGTELIICKALKWKLNHNHVTVNTWMNTYMQLISIHFRPPGLKAKEFEYPAYSPLEFIRAMQLLDLCILDISSRQFCTSILSASALYLISEKCQTNLNIITGYHLSDISLCVKWMEPFLMVINGTKPAIQRAFKGVILQDAHNIQTHDVTLSMLEDANELRKQQPLQFQPPMSGHMPIPYGTDPSMYAPASQAFTLMDCSILMTPPRQERRCLAPINSTIV